MLHAQDVRVARCSTKERRDHGDQNARHGRRADDAGDVRAHRVHQEIVVRVFVLTHVLDDSRGHRHRRNASGADHRVNFAFRNQVHQLREQHPSDGRGREGE